MPKLFVTNRSGTQASVDGPVGLSVMEILRNNGFDEVLALCGGSCSCATCHVYADGRYLDRLAPMRPDERLLLDASDHRTPNSRLACQISFSEALDGLAVTIAPPD
jgi:2Fe-2S ferredoxin